MSSFQLSSLAGSAVQFSITLEENEKTQIPDEHLVNTSARSNGSATALTLLAYDQSPKINGICLIEGLSTQTGNSCLIPISGSVLEQYSGSNSYSSGASTLLVSTSGNGETCFLTYRTNSNISSGNYKPSDGYVFLTYGVDVIAPNGNSWTQSNLDSDVVYFKNSSLVDNEYLCTREGGVVDETLKNRWQGSSGEIVLSLMLDYGRFIEIGLSQTLQPSSTVFTPSLPNSGRWVAYQIYQRPSSTLATLFNSPSPSNGDVALALCSEITSISSKKRAIKCLFNAIQIVGNDSSRYGGGINSYG